MSKNFSTRIGATVAAGTFIAMCFAGPATAAKPAEQGCLGDFMSSGAQAFGNGFGQQISFFAGNHSPLDVSFGVAVQNLQAGTAPLFPGACNTPE